MKKLNLEDLPNNEKLTEEQMKDLVGGVKGALDLNMTSGSGLSGIRKNSLRSARDNSGFRKRGELESSLRRDPNKSGKRI